MKITFNKALVITFLCALANQVSMIQAAESVQPTKVLSFTEKIRLINQRAQAEKAHNGIAVPENVAQPGVETAQLIENDEENEAESAIIDAQAFAKRSQKAAKQANQKAAKAANAAAKAKKVARQALKEVKKLTQENEEIAGLTPVQAEVQALVSKNRSSGLNGLPAVAREDSDSEDADDEASDEEMENDIEGQSPLSHVVKVVIAQEVCKKAFNYASGNQVACGKVFSYVFSHPFISIAGLLASAVAFKGLAYGYENLTLANASLAYNTAHSVIAPRATEIFSGAAATAGIAGLVILAKKARNVALTKTVGGVAVLSGLAASAGLVGLGLFGENKKNELLAAPRLAMQRAKAWWYKTQ